MDGKQKGFTLIEILVVVTIIGVLAGLVVVLIPKGQFEAKKAECMNNIRQIVGILEPMGTSYPKYAGPNLMLYLVKRGELKGKDSLDLLFCPGDEKESLQDAGGEDGYKDLDLKKQGEYGELTSYAGRSRTGDCAAKKGSSQPVVLVCDDDEDHHDKKGLVCGLTGGAVKWRHKVDDWGMDVETPVEIGEASNVDELKCMVGD